MYQNIRCFSLWGSLLLAMVCALSAAGETRSLYQKGKITIILEDVPLKTVFDAIEEQVQVRFMYDMMVVDDKQKVSIHAKEVTLEYLLGQLLEGKPLKWSRKEKVIRIEPRSLGTPERSEERRVGKEGVSTCRYRGSRDKKKK